MYLQISELRLCGHCHQLDKLEDTIEVNSFEAATKFLTEESDEAYIPSIMLADGDKQYIPQITWVEKKLTLGK